jgi:hypothetical protein
MRGFHDVLNTKPSSLSILFRWCKIMVTTLMTRVHVMGFDGGYFGVPKLDVMLPTEAVPFSTKVE